MYTTQDPGSAYVWYDDFRNPNISAVVAKLGVRTFGDLSELSADQLLAAGMEIGEVSLVRSLLRKHGLGLGS